MCSQVTLEGRAGALAAMQSLLQHCPELVTEDQVRRLLVPLEAAITMLNRYAPHYLRTSVESSLPPAVP